jgi:hypothetical protein
MQRKQRILRKQTFGIMYLPKRTAEVFPREKRAAAHRRTLPEDIQRTGLRKTDLLFIKIGGIKKIIHEYGRAGYGI